MTGLGTRLRHLLELLDDDIAKLYPDLGLDEEFRPRFTPVVRVLRAQGPMPIRDLARELGVTHSAASQTVARMRRLDLVELAAGSDARQRIVCLTDAAERLAPILDYEWRVVEEAARRLDEELPCPLREVVEAAIGALERRSFRERIGEVMAE